MDFQPNAAQQDFVLFDDHKAYDPRLTRRSTVSNPVQTQIDSNSTAFAGGLSQASSSFTSVTSSTDNSTVNYRVPLNNNSNLNRHWFTQSDANNNNKSHLFHRNTTGSSNTNKVSSFGPPAMTRDADQLNTMHSPIMPFDEPLDFGFDTHEVPTHHGFTAANNAAVTSNMNFSATVSPQEILLDYNPPSNSFTNLTTPSLYDGSPDMTDSYDVSPMLDTIDADNSGWFSLFPEEKDTKPTIVAADYHELADSHESWEMERTPSGASTDGKADTLYRLSLTSGINKSGRRATKTLGPIEVDSNDERAVKRAKNTMAARKSRQKKRDVEDSLRTALDAMTAERDHWRHVAIAHGAPVPEK